MPNTTNGKKRVLYFTLLHFILFYFTSLNISLYTLHSKLSAVKASAVVVELSFDGVVKPRS